MKTGYRGKGRTLRLKQQWAENTARALVPLSINVSKKVRDYLETKAHEERMTVSTLVAIAIDNELDCEQPFVFHKNIDHIPYVDEDNVQSRKLFDYISRCPGLGLEHLALNRRDYGIETREEVFIAYRHLVKIGMIEEYRPKDYMKYPMGYKLVKVMNANERGTLNDIKKD